MYFLSLSRWIRSSTDYNKRDLIYVAAFTYKCMREHSDAYLVVGRVKCRAFTRGARLRLRGLLRSVRSSEPRWNHDAPCPTCRTSSRRRDRVDLMRKRARRDLAIFSFFYDIYRVTFFFSCNDFFFYVRCRALTYTHNLSFRDHLGSFSSPSMA